MQFVYFVVMKAGLIGFPLEHSFSQTYFSEKFFREGRKDCSYETFAIENISLLPSLLQKHPELSGLNVTIPYKERVIRYLNTMTEEAKMLGAVNTIKIENGILRGFNTDVFGFMHSLKPLLKEQHRKALVLGTGGAAKAVAYVLTQLKIEYQLVSRSLGDKRELSYQTLSEDIVEEHKLIVNTTPLGMQPDVLSFPDIPYEALSSKHLLYDLVYNPEKSIFLIKGQQQGAEIKNGLEMLYLQAEKSWEIWTA